MNHEFGCAVTKRRLVNELELQIFHETVPHTCTTFQKLTPRFTQKESQEFHSNTNIAFACGWVHVTSISQF